MTEQEETAETSPPKASKIPMLIGLVLAVVGASAGFYVTWSGMLFGGSDTHQKTDVHHEKPAEKSAIKYVEIDPLTISLRPPAKAQYLRFRASLEVEAAAENEVAELMPRFMDVMNSYLRALEPSELEEAAALVRLRSQLLRRIQVVAGHDKVRDLLIMEFVLN